VSYVGRAKEIRQVFQPGCRLSLMAVPGPVFAFDDSSFAEIHCSEALRLKSVRHPVVVILTDQNQAVNARAS
jgi:hypothetical protein